MIFRLAGAGFFLRKIQARWLGMCLINDGLVGLTKPVGINRRDNTKNLMKFQFQFAGASVSRSGTQQRKLLRMGILLCVLVLAALAYGHYLYRMTHGKIMSPAVVQSSVSVPATVAATVAVAAHTPAAVTGPQTLPPALKRAADAGAAAIGTMLVEAVKVPAPTTPQTESVKAPALPVKAAPLAAPVPFKIVPVPAARPHTKVLTPEQQLTLAGQTAMDKMLAMASKYPDAYGFRAEDIFGEVKLGAAIPVYAISEKDRTGYKAGQPLDQLLKPAKQWVFPVLSNGRLCCLVQVSHNGHEYVPGSASKALAQAWTKISEKWPVEDGYHPKLIVNHGIPGYYFTVPEAGIPNITDTVQMFYFHPSLSPADVILASWR
jgi:hypothetical protein